jgi:hypothetical protein
MRARLEPRPTSTPDGGLVRGNERRFVLVRRDLTLASFVGDGALGFTRRSRAFMGKCRLCGRSSLPAKLFRQPTDAALHVRE